MRHAAERPKLLKDGTPVDSFTASSKYLYVVVSTICPSTKPYSAGDICTNPALHSCARSTSKVTKVKIHDASVEQGTGFISGRVAAFLVCCSAIVS